MKDKKKILAFLQGMCMCNNIFYVFNYNTFYLNISSVISIIVFLYVLINEKESFTKYLKNISKWFYLFLFLNIISIIPMTFYFINNSSITNAFFNGIPSLILIFLQYFSIVALYDKKEYIYKGITLGFILNIGYSVLQYFFFERGTMITFANWFPNPAFRVMVQFQNRGLYPQFDINQFVYGYGALGFFLEGSYFMIFIIGSILIVNNVIKNNIIKVITLIITIVLCILTKSANLLTLFSMICLYWFILFIKKIKIKKTIKRSVFLFIPIFVLFIIAGIYMIVSNDNMIDSFRVSVDSLNFNNTNNTERATSMIRGLELISKYPLGVGYNMSSAIYSLEYGSQYVNAIFSTLLVNELELGILGNLVYIIFSLSLIIYAIKSKDKLMVSVGISALGLFICQISNGISYSKMLYIISIYALINAEMYANKNTKTEKC